MYIYVYILIYVYVQRLFNINKGGIFVMYKIITFVGDFESLVGVSRTEA